MKRILLALVVAVSSNGFSQDVKRALFLGNSYTYFNDLPKMIGQIASSMGDSLWTDQNTPGGYTLQGHSTNSTSLNKIDSKSWDFVILQEQSQRPSFSPGQVQNDVYPYAKLLVDRIKANDSCTDVLFFMTWGRKYGDQSNCQFYPPICTYAGMQQRLRESYVEMAEDNAVSVSPVGMAWKAFIAVDSTTNLYTPDNSHPSINGSYLAACVFYSSMFHRSSVGAFIPSGVNSGVGFAMQNIADQVVFDSLNVWRIDTTSMKANFNYTQNANQVQFNDLSDSADSWLWQFGTGDSSDLQNPSYTYPNGAGDYLVHLTTTRNCLSAQYQDTIQVLASGFMESEMNEHLTLYPNPVTDELHILSKALIQNIRLINANTGQTIFSEGVGTNQHQLNLTEYDEGAYLLMIKTEEGIRRELIFKK